MMFVQRDSRRRKRSEKECVVNSGPSSKRERGGREGNRERGGAKRGERERERERERGREGEGKVLRTQAEGKPGCKSLGVTVILVLLTAFCFRAILKSDFTEEEEREKEREKKREERREKSLFFLFSVSCERV
jgi:hypothetical protein